MQNLPTRSSKVSESTRRQFRCISSQSPICVTSCSERVQALESRLELVRSFPQGLENAEATGAISKADFKSKSYIALKEARESLYWIDLLHQNGYLTDEQHRSIYADGEELVKVLTHRCKKLDGVE